MSNQKGIILTITLIFVIVLVIIAGVSIVLMTNQARITEYQIKRIRVFYTAEAALTHVLQGFRTGAFSVPLIGIATWDSTTTPPIPVINGFPASVTINSATTGPNNTHNMSVMVDY